jgi:hypothetical protein
MLKLFTVGDSISQGFMSGAAARTDLCYSTLLAKLFGIADYKYPDWPEGGLPVNIEELFRLLEKNYGTDINTLEWTLAFAATIPRFLDKVEAFYERDDYAADKPYPDKTIQYFHNVAVRGFNVSDAWLIDGAYCQRKIKESGTKDDFYAAPNESLVRTALKVLNPSLKKEHNKKSQLDWLDYHVQNGGIENVIVWLGANNALGTIVDLSINYSPGKGETATLSRDEILKYGWNLWHPIDFAADYSILLDKIDAALAGTSTKVFLATIPMVTIAPLAKGVGETFEVKIPNDDGKDDIVTYFKFYTYFPFDEAYAFKTGINLSFTQALHVDNCIRDYNKTIKNLITERNNRQPGRYHLVDLADVLDKLAFKRNNGVPCYEFPPYFSFKYPTPNTKYYHADMAGNLKQGGIFSLDGVHPTAIAHGLIAYEFLKVMHQANVPGANPDGLDWEAIFASDRLYQEPIKIMHEVYDNTHLAEWVLRFAKGFHREETKREKEG